MNRTHTLLARSIATLAVACAAAAPSWAASCKDVTFSLNNVSSGPITVTKVRYRDLDAADTSRRWEQNVTDFACPSGFSCTTNAVNLGSSTRARRNHELTDIQFLHQHLDAFGNWMSAVWSSMNTPSTMTCTDGRNYGAYDVN